MSESPPDVWGLLEDAAAILDRIRAGEDRESAYYLAGRLKIARSKRDRWQLVPKELTNTMSFELFSRRNVPVQELWEAALAASPKPKE